MRVVEETIADRVGDGGVFGGTCDVITVDE